MADAEITFTVHPRPVADVPHPDHDISTSAASKLADSASKAPEDVSRHRDTILGDILFLARYMFGRY